MSPVLRRKLTMVVFVEAVFGTLGIIGAIETGAPVDVGLVGIPIIVFGIAAFEEFYVQGRAGMWMRRMRP